MSLPVNISIDVDGPTVSLNPRDPAFLQNPYPAYLTIRDAAPMFYWKEYGIWCAASYELVFGLLRDRRFGGRRRTCACRGSLPRVLGP